MFQLLVVVAVSRPAATKISSSSPIRLDVTQNRVVVLTTAAAIRVCWGDNERTRFELSMWRRPGAAGTKACPGTVLSWLIFARN